MSTTQACGVIDPTMSTPLQQRGCVIEGAVRLGTQSDNRGNDDQQDQAEHDRILGRSSAVFFHEEASEMALHPFPQSICSRPVH
jgi:hypothetical protein